MHAIEELQQTAVELEAGLEVVRSVLRALSCLLAGTKDADEVLRMHILFPEPAKCTVALRDDSARSAAHV